MQIGTEPLGRWLPRLATAAVWLLVIVVVGTMLVRPDEFQWDLRVFHAAAQMLASDSNIYDRAARDVELAPNLGYIYPPLLLYVFRPLGLMSFGTAYVVWFGLKLFVLACLLRLWHRHFERLDFGWATVLFIVIAFNAALLRDLASGNIALLEQLGLWIAFWQVLRGHPYRAGVLIAAVAQFKLVPLVFIGVLPFIGPRRGWKPLWAALAAFAGLLGLNLLLMPQRSLQFIGMFLDFDANFDERGPYNPSAQALFRDVAEVLPKLGFSPGAGDLLYGLYLAACAIALAALLWRYYRTLPALDQATLIYAACCLYALTAPRMKDYTYVILLIPALFVLRRLTSAAAFAVIAGLLVLGMPTTNVPWLNLILWNVPRYMPLLTAAVVLCLLVSVLRQELERRVAARPAG